MPLANDAPTSPRHAKAGYAKCWHTLLLDLLCQTFLNGDGFRHADRLLGGPDWLWREIAFGAPPGSGRPLALRVMPTRTAISWSHKIWQESRTLPYRSRSTSLAFSGLGHLLRLTGDKFDPAGGAAGMAAAVVQNVTAIRLNRIDEARIRVVQSVFSVDYYFCHSRHFLQISRECTYGRSAGNCVQYRYRNSEALHQ